MPQLPYNQEVDARTGRLDGSGLNVNTNPTAFGYDQGKALQQAGSTIQDAGGQLQDYAHKLKEKKQAEDVANGVAKFDFSPTQQNLIDQAPADGQGLHDGMSVAFDDAVSNYTKDIKDDTIRKETYTRLMAQRPGVLEQATQHQDVLAKTYSKDNTDQALASIQNKAAIDPSPTSFDNLLEQGKGVIRDTTAMVETAKSAVFKTFVNDLTNRRFEGMIQVAKTPADLDNIAAEMAGKDANGNAWSDRFDPKDFHTLIDKVGSMKRSLQEHLTTGTRAVLTAAKERQDKGSDLPDDELQIMHDQVKQTGDAALTNESAEITYHNQIIKIAKRLPPAEQQAQINAAAGNPGAAYPNTPVAISNAINAATNKYGVSAGLMGGLVHSEKGYSVPDKVPVDAKYTPLPAKGVDLRNLRSDVRDALTNAGKALGRPLPLMPGSNGISANIPTIGVAEADKAKLAGALVDAGFIGVADNQDSMSFYFTHAVPQQFQKQPDGRTWGGWTFLSPEVTKMLESKGFAAGADAKTLKRALPQQPEPDYGVQPKDKNGKILSSAVGVGQFLEGTWRDMMKDPAITAALGVDTRGKTDQQLLDLRKDPALSVAAMAINALKNQKTMEAALGRPVSDAELAMAHVMGASGATSFLTAYAHQPDQFAADLMPEAAKANPGLFYNNGAAKTVAQVHDDVAFSYALAPNKIIYSANQVRTKVLENTEKELKDDPMAHAESVGSHVISPLTDDPESFKQRGIQAMAVAQYNDIPMREMKPFKNAETDRLKSQMDAGDADSILHVMANIQSMGEIPAKAGMKQIEAKDAVFAHAGSLYLDGATDVAGDIVRGRKMVQENPALKDQMGLDETTIATAFAKATGTALDNIDYAHRQTTQEAALAHYLYQQTKTASGHKAFNSDAYAASVRAVMGGTAEFPSFAFVNGYNTVVPKGLSSSDFQDGIRNMDIGDYIKMSATGDPPLHSDGAVVNPKDIAGEVMPQYGGNGQYVMLLEDGTKLWSGKYGADGRPVPYKFKPDVKAIRDIAARMPPDEIHAYNTMAGRGFGK